MIRPILNMVCQRGRQAISSQRGGIAILTALGFILFSVPLITASLNLAQNTAIDSRVKSGITGRHYCGLATREYLNYLLSDADRWADWLAANPGSGEDLYSETRNLCGQNITIAALQEPGLLPGAVDDSLDNDSSVPNMSPYNTNRDFEVSVTVSNPDPTPGDSVVYTITVVNRDATQTDISLSQIQETLPTGFSYDCNATPDQLTLPGLTAQNWTPKGGSCPSGTGVDWDVGVLIPHGETAILTFTAVTSQVPGTYCNEARVMPGGQRTSTGLTASVQIGSTPGDCPGEAIEITKTWTSVGLNGTDTDASPWEYDLDIGYEIKIKNTGTEELDLNKFTDLLPEGFTYLSPMDLSGDITTDPTTATTALNRQELTWAFSLTLAVEETQTLRFNANAIMTKGNHWSDLITGFAGGTFPQNIYSWPTAVVGVRDVFIITATLDSGEEVIATQILVAADSGTVSTWTLP